MGDEIGPEQEARGSYRGAHLHRCPTVTKVEPLIGFTETELFVLTQWPGEVCGAVIMPNTECRLPPGHDDSCCPFADEIAAEGWRVETILGPI